MLELEISPTDFPNMCRLCLKMEYSHDLLESSKHLNLIHKITNIKVHEDDSLPQKACKNCINKLDEIREFIEICNNNNEILSNFTDEKIIKLELQDLLGNNNCTDSDDQGSVISFKNYADYSDDYDDERNKCYMCKYCLRPFLSEGRLKRHVEKICTEKNKPKSDTKWTCLICDWIGISKSALRTHERKEHTENIEISIGLKKKKWKCSQCGKLFTKKIDLQRHRRTHTGARPFSCNLCGKSFTQKSTLERHMISKHFESKEGRYHYECYICERKFVRKDHLEAHIKHVHIKRQSNEEPLEVSTYLDSRTCKICGKNFSLYSYLQNHLIVHEETKKFKRPPKIRNCRFATSSNLCSICGKSFEKRKTYQMHMNRKHSNKKYEPKPKPKIDIKRDNFQCWHCGKIFTTHSNLKVHIRIHTGEKPYECKFCGQRFAAYSSWHEHENIHTGAKPFQCEFCKKGFRQRGSLRKHLRSSVHRKQLETQ